MPKLKVNDIEVIVEDGATVLQACEEAGFEISRFCYHERLSIAGNCRMCLVEMDKSPKPIASCAMPAGEGMNIKTNSESVKKARNGVMEFLLLNHPLDCPICDQGGECDLQDQAMGYGHDKSRFLENKRAVTEKNMGPLIKTVMTRCIHCTRCVRFATEVAGVPDLGAVGRGENVEISTYLENSLNSELSGNIIDLCPVGALTSKPYAFVARPWELNKIETIDVMDALGSNIRIDSRGGQVLRVLPRVNDEINEEWISDKTRYAIDGLRNQRLDVPYIRNQSGNLVPSTWEEAFEKIAKKLKKLNSNEFAAISGDLVDVETLFALKLLFKKLNCPNIDCRQDGAYLTPNNRPSYIFNSSIAGIDKTDAILIVGSNPKIESAVLNARIRKNFLERKIPIALIGNKVGLNYDYKFLGDNPNVLSDLLLGKNNFFKILKKAKKPMIILGMGALRRKDSESILNLSFELANETGMFLNDWNGFNVLNVAASRVGGMDIGFLPGKGGKNTKKIINECHKGKIKLLWMLGADEIDVSKIKNSFIVYQGHHGDNSAKIADVILPGAAYTEKNGIYVNCEGRVQQAIRATFPPGDAKEDWKIIKAFSDKLNLSLNFDTHQSLRNLLFENFPHFEKFGEIKSSKIKKIGKSGNLVNEKFNDTFSNFYMTCSISRSSITMSKCLRELKFI